MGNLKNFPEKIWAIYSVIHPRAFTVLEINKRQIFHKINTKLETISDRRSATAKISKLLFHINWTFGGPLKTHNGPITEKFLY